MNRNNAGVIVLLILLLVGVAVWMGIPREEKPDAPPADQKIVAGTEKSPEIETESADSKSPGPEGEAEKIPGGKKGTAEPLQISVPVEIRDPKWMAYRQRAQMNSTQKFNVFYEFKFEDRFEESGIQFEHKIVDDAGRAHKAVHYDHGNGIVAADVDGDELLDLYFITQVGPNGLWKNLGNGKFRDITAEAGVAVADRISVSASFADTDNDGDADLFVTTVRGGNLLFENDGHGKFKDVTSDSALGYNGHSSGAVFFDFDRDGLLDLFVCNVGVYTTDETGPGGYYIGFKDAFAGHLKPETRNERSILYRNLGKNRFQDVSEQVGLLDESWTGDAAIIDYNGDGWLDLYVLNMQGNDQFYENDKGQRFVRKSRKVFPKTPWGAMGIGIFDFDNDGDMDILVTDMHSDMSKNILFDLRSELSIETGFQEEKKKMLTTLPESLLKSEGMSIYGNALYRNNGDGSFEEVSDSLGVENYWPWGLSVADLNADGFQDVFITSSMNYPYRYGVNSLLLNNRGREFLDSEFLLGIEPRKGGRTAKPWFTLDSEGADKDHPLSKDQTGIIEVWGAVGSRSSVIFDIDGDGDLDIVTSEFNDRPMVLVSDLADQKKLSWLMLSLVGTSSNRDGIGTRVTVTAGTNTYTFVYDGKSGYLSQSSMPLYIGLDAAKTVDRIELLWPSGNRQVVEGPIQTNQKMTVTEKPDAGKSGNANPQ